MEDLPRHLELRSGRRAGLDGHAVADVDPDVTEGSRIWLSWSSGKDSAWALHLLRQSPDVEVVALLTTFNETADRVAMHAVRRELVRRQARGVRLPLVEIPLPHPCPNDAYEKRMLAACARAESEGIDAIAFGDLYLEDVRVYREAQLESTRLDALFPLWGLDTRELARQMVAQGLRARVTCVDPKQIDAAFAGRVFDDAFLDDLPPGADPCAERGEFHSFAVSGPMFSSDIAAKS